MKDKPNLLDSMRSEMGEAPGATEMQAQVPSQINTDSGLSQVPSLLDGGISPDTLATGMEVAKAVVAKFGVARTVTGVGLLSLVVGGALMLASSPTSNDHKTLK